MIMILMYMYFQCLRKFTISLQTINIFKHQSYIRCTVIRLANLEFV